MKSVIPLFFAVDDNYVKFLSVTLESIFENCSKDYSYDVVVLNTGLKQESKNILNKYLSDDVNIEFFDVRYKLQKISQDLSIRDYYTKATYYRLFIADLFPQYDKALYLDCDIVVLGDVAKLYNTDLENNLVAAIPDGAVQLVDEFIDYVELGLGIKKDKYFNAGVLLINLKEFRNTALEERFVQLLKQYTFEIAQDQDYLNILCKDKVTYVDDSWNVMPLGNYVKPVNLIHYNLSFKPWKYDNIQYEDYFWEYAKKANVYEDIMLLKNSFSLDMANKEKEGSKLLKINARKEAYSSSNYFNRFVKRDNFICRFKTKIKNFFYK